SEGISYKTIERFFDKKIDWLGLKWKMVESVIGKEVILVADESTVSKSGKVTHGLGYFYSGLQGRAIKGISFLSFSLVDVESRRAYPLFTKQLKKEQKKKVDKKEKKARGRPKGSKNKNSSTLRLKGLFRIVGWYIRIIRKVISIPTLQYFVYDGAFGNNVGIQTVRRNGLHLISKLKKNSNLYFKFKGKQKTRGRKRIYGELIDYENIDEKYLKVTKVEDDIEVKIYQLQALHKKIYGALNIVIIFSTNLSSKKTTHTILFSTDLKQEYQKIIEYYSLRFQIEFNFRDAKQFFGLEDFMNIKRRRIHNFANLSMFMNNLSFLIHKETGFSNYSVNDLKSFFMAEKYAHEILKLYGEKVDDILIH
ncbi:MAG: transposase, partial [Sulfurovaceae bacterium]|nr:transposase [Sulfurovaceae bacterium]